MSKPEKVLGVCLILWLIILNKSWKAALAALVGCVAITGLFFFFRWFDAPEKPKA